MYTLAELIKANGDELAELESLDNGKPLAAAKGDVAASVAHLRYYAGWPTKIEGETIPVSAPRPVLSTRCASRSASAPRSCPWNFPLLMAVWKIAPALAAGCPLVLKPAEQTPLTALRLGELALEAGFPRRARSTSSPATARPAPRWSTTRASTRSPSPARPRSAARSAPSAARRSSG